MNPNPYAPPTTAVADIRPQDGGLPPFFAVSLLKLAVLSLCTLGIYELYWFYRNWQHVKARGESDILPFWRAFFAILFCYSCFKRIRDVGVERGIEPVLSAGAFATGWIVMTLTWKAPDPYGWITFFAVAFLLPVQAHVNRINAAVAPGHDRNARFSAWNWLATVIGAGMLVLLAMDAVAS